MSQTIPAIVAGNPAREAVYHALIALVTTFGPLEVEEKKTCLHLAVGGKAFLGVHPRKEGLRLTIPLTRELADPRIVKAERASKNRVHNDIDLRSPEIDPEVAAWFREAYELRRQ